VPVITKIKIKCSYYATGHWPRAAYTKAKPPSAQYFISLKLLLMEQSGDPVRLRGFKEKLRRYKNKIFTKKVVNVDTGTPTESQPRPTVVPASLTEVLVEPGSQEARTSPEISHLPSTNPVLKPYLH
jgi:hypothetical protein